MNTTYVVLPRGINVGGKNKVGMAELKQRLGEAGFTDVATHGLAGNLLVRSPLPAAEVSTTVEALLQSKFRLDSAAMMVVAVAEAEFRKIVASAPAEFGADDDAYRYYVLFLKGIGAAAAMKDIEARPGVDMVWAGPSAIYFQLPSLTSPNRGKSWLNRITQKPLYQQVTMRNWATTTRILALLDNHGAAE